MAHAETHNAIVEEAHGGRKNREALDVATPHSDGLPQVPQSPEHTKKQPHLSNSVVPAQLKTNHSSSPHLLTMHSTEPTSLPTKQPTTSSTPSPKTHKSGTTLSMLWVKNWNLENANASYMRGKLMTKASSLLHQPTKTQSQSVKTKQNKPKQSPS